jgi:O-antigen/teichoic acid export membrane protein
LFIDYVVRIPLWSGKYFIHPDYWDGMGIAIIIMLGYLINGITTNFAAVFHIEKKTKYLPLTIGVSAIASIILNFILIPIFGSWGAALALVFGYSMGAIFTKILHKKIDYKINYEWKRIAIIGFASVLTLFFGKFITNSFDLTVAFFIKIGILFCYLLLLKVFGFFTAGELSQIRKIFRR